MKPCKNFLIARCSAKTGYSLLAHPDAYTRLEIKPIRPSEMLFHVYRDGQYTRQIRLQTSGTLAERKLQLPHVALDREWFDSLILELNWPDVIEADYEGNIVKEI